MLEIGATYLYGRMFVHLWRHKSINLWGIFLLNETYRWGYMDYISQGYTTHDKGILMSNDCLINHGYHT